jgi:serine/threonine protein phosphatase PrpC
VWLRASYCSPHTTETLLSTCGHCPFLVLACDGVWDVFSDQEAVDLLMEKYKENGCKPFEDAAALLVSISKNVSTGITNYVLSIGRSVYR